MIPESCEARARRVGYKLILAILKSRKSWFRQVARHEQVRALHNFLVGQDRIVVHNGYIRADIDDLRAKYKNNPQGIDEIADPFTKEVVQMSDADYALLREELYFAVGTITDPVLGSNLFPVFRLDWGSAWKALSDLPPSVKTDVFNLETVSRHLDDTGKLADDVAAEIAQSGSYTKWLSDKLVTYVKNGHKITKNTIDDAFDHINGVKLNGAGHPTYNNTQGIVGAHNLDAFNGQTIANGGRIEIVNNASTSVNGVNKIEYKVLAADSGGNPIPGQYFANGKVFNKTTFDPGVYDQATMKSIGYDGYRNAIDNNSFGSARSFSGTSGNYPVAGHYKDVGGENVINTWWIDAN